MRYVVDDRVAVFDSYNQSWQYGIVDYIGPARGDLMYYNIMLDANEYDANIYIQAYRWQLVSLPTIKKLKTL